MRKQLMITLFILTITLALIFYDEISQAIIILAYTVAGLLAVSFLLIAVLIIWYVIERMKLLRARRLEAEKRAHVMTLAVGDQVYVRDTDHQAIWRALHLEAKTYINSQYSEPSSTEMQRWQLFNAPPRAAGQLLELPPPQAQIDLLTALDNEQRVLVKGPSNAGKTNLLQWIADRKQNISQVLVIDPHASPNKWPGCQVAGVGSNHAEIEDVLTKLIGIMVQRYKEIAQGLVREGEHPKLTVIIDEWMSISYQCKNATDTVIRLLTESRKAAFSIFIGSHSDRVKSLGLDGRGDLREGFVLVKLSIVSGQRKATIDLGNGEIPATLPDKYQSNAQMKIGGTSQDDFINLEVEPNPTEAAILNLWDAGIKQKKEISIGVFGSVGGNQYKKIESVLEKFNRL